MKILVTGSAGLIGGEVVSYFASRSYQVFGIDNNSREFFFGIAGSTNWNKDRLLKNYRNYQHYEIDIRNREQLMEAVAAIKPDAIVHAAAQPSHDLAASLPFDDFEVNALGTLNLLEAARRLCPDAPFVYLSTNKIYGDRPNYLKLTETDLRYDFIDPAYRNGIPETFGIDACTHSLFGVSKLSADLMVQEYGRYFGMPTCCLRGGCLTGPYHSGVQLHGFLSYLIKCFVTKTKYQIIGHKGKQVRDNIHAFDVSSFIALFIESPKSAAIYNIGGGKPNSVSILETFQILRDLTGREAVYDVIEKPRIGDHIVYYSDLSKIKEDYPTWEITKPVRDIIIEIYTSWEDRIPEL